MATQAVQQPEGRIRQVGKVVTQVTITNKADETLATHGFRPESAIRTLSLDEVLVDTGATTLCLPLDMVRALGLEHVRDIVVSTATSVDQVGLYEGARVTLHGRSATVECMALPVGSPPLLGVIPLEMLGLEPDLQNRRLRLLPETGRETHYLAPSPVIR